MNYEAALEWLKGDRSTANHFRSMVSERAFEQREIWMARADAAMTEQAYWVVRAHREGLIGERNKRKAAMSFDLATDPNPGDTLRWLDEDRRSQ